MSDAESIHAPNAGTTVNPAAHTAPPSTATAVLDPGWLFVVAGTALIGAALLIPAADDLAEARFLRDRAMAIEQHRLERLSRHEEFLEGLEAKDQTLALSLAASQLNQIPADRTPLPQPTAGKEKVVRPVSTRPPGAKDGPTSPAPSAGSLDLYPEDESLGLTDASVFPALEPPPVQLPQRHRGDSILERLVLSPKTGLWVGLAGALSVMIGLLPRSRR